MKKITFIGAGNMAASIIGGLIEQGYRADSITATDPNDEALARIQQSYAIQVNKDNLAACESADVVILAVKPQVLKTVCAHIAPVVRHKPLIVSIAAGITIGQLCQWLDDKMPVVRCMPNTPALVQLGATGLYANEWVSDGQKEIAEQLLGAVGLISWLENEQQLDVVTAVSGSGPAYYFLLMEAMIEAAVSQGLSKQQATELTLQTALGAAKLAQNSDVDVAELRRRVTSPGGTTEQAIHTYEERDLRTIVAEAMKACADRAASLAKEFN